MFPWIHEHFLSLLIASPLFGVAILLILPRRHEAAASEISIFSAGVTLFMSLVMFGLFDGSSRFSFYEKHDFLSIVGSSYHVGIDGMSLLLLLATSITAFVYILINWKRPQIQKKEIFALLLCFELGLIGFFSSLDILMMYIFSEIAIISLGFMMLLIKNSPSRLLSRFAGFMGFSSIVFLTVIVYLMIAAGTSDLLKVETISIIRDIQVGLFIMMLIVAMCRMGLFPLHGWVREMFDDSVEYALIPCGLVFVSGGYLLYRFLPSFAQASSIVQPVLVWAVSAMIIVSALIALGHKDLSKLLIYIFMVHFGFVLLGLISINQQSLAGSNMQLIVLPVYLMAISIVLSMLKKWGIDLASANFDGAFVEAPIVGTCFLIIMFAMSGLPALSLFPGLFMICMGLFKGNWILAVAALIGIVILGVSLIMLAMRALFRVEARDKERRPRTSYVVVLVPLIFLIVGIGIYPDVILKYVKQSTEVFWNLFVQQM